MMTYAPKQEDTGNFCTDSNGRSTSLLCRLQRKLAFRRHGGTADGRVRLMFFELRYGDNLPKQGVMRDEHSVCGHALKLQACAQVTPLEHLGSSGHERIAKKIQKEL